MRRTIELVTLGALEGTRCLRNTRGACTGMCGDNMRSNLEGGTVQFSWCINWHKKIVKYQSVRIFSLKNQFWFLDLALNLANYGYFFLLAVVLTLVAFGFDLIILVRRKYLFIIHYWEFQNDRWHYRFKLNKVRWLCKTYHFLPSHRRSKDVMCRR